MSGPSPPAGLDVSAWTARRTLASRCPSADAVRRLKQRQTVTLLIPALDEAATIGNIVSAVRGHPSTRALLDELVVVDSGSVDGTVDVARRAGATVVRAAAVAPDLPRGGKGGAVWRGLSETGGDVVVLVDGDLVRFDPEWVVALAVPLLEDETLHLVKAAAPRPLVQGSLTQPDGGGRVTELVARPLLNALWPELRGVVQPLAGEVAVRRSLLEVIPVATGYGLEIGMLIDTYDRVGLDGIAQVLLGPRVHRHQGEAALGRMSSAVLRTALARRGLTDLPSELMQFGWSASAQLLPASSEVPVQDLPPQAPRADGSTRLLGQA